MKLGIIGSFLVVLFYLPGSDLAQRSQNQDQVGAGTTRPVRRVQTLVQSYAFNNNNTKLLIFYQPPACGVTIPAAITGYCGYHRQ